MVTVINLAEAVERRAADLADLGTLGCPVCGREAPAAAIVDGGTLYHCKNGHRGRLWRLMDDGDVLAGRTGKRPVVFAQ
jgi:hypothetical protein